MALELTHELVQRLWNVHHLGKVETLVLSTRGINNPGALVNDSLFLRVDGLPGWQVSRFAGETRAYELLKGSGVPVPEVVVLDTSRVHLPHDYMVMTKVTGQQVIECWHTLNPDEQQQVAYEAGRYLAIMHSLSLPQVGYIYDLPQKGFEHWRDFVDTFYQNYRKWGLENGALSDSLAARMDAMMQRMYPLLDAITNKGLIHGDYHHANILQHNGHITGILDFEWSKVGDGSWDFKVDKQWENECPGSRAPMYAGYEAVRPLDAHHLHRSILSRILMLLDDVVEQHGVSDRSPQALEMMLAEIATLEGLL